MAQMQRRMQDIVRVLVLLGLILAACAPAPGTVTPRPATATPAEKDWTPGNLMPIIRAASILEPIESNKGIEIISDREEGDYRYVQEKHNVIKNRESVLFLGLNDDVLYPGALIQGKDVYDFIYPPIITPRTPITMSLSLEGVTTTGESIKTTVDDPSRLSNVRQGINNLLKTAIKPDTIVPAKFDYVSEQVYSSQEKNLALGVSASYADVSMDYDFNWNSKSRKNKILSTYKQVYYTVDVDLPARPYDFFDPDAGVEEVEVALPAGSMPMYVSSVSYGWMGVLFIETDYSKDELDMALNVAYDPAGNVEAKLGFGYSTKDVLQSSKIQIIVYGGSTAGITRNTLSGYSGLMELIQGSKEFDSSSPGVPLSFKLRHLSNNLIARIALTEEYTVTRAIKLREFVRISVDQFNCIWDDDAYGQLDMDRFFFWVKVYAGNRQILDKQILAWFCTGCEHDMEKGDSWSPPEKASTVVMLDLRNLDPDAYHVVLEAWARDYDGNDADSDWAKNSTSISGDQLFNPYNIFFQIKESSNMTFEVFYTIAASTSAECQTYPECSKQLPVQTP